MNKVERWRPLTRNLASLDAVSNDKRNYGRPNWPELENSPRYSDQLDHESPTKSDKLFLLDAMLDDYPTVTVTNAGE